MKKTFLISITVFAYCILFTSYSFSQGTAINNTGNTADSSAMLDVSSTNKGTLLTRMTTAERNNIVNPASSLIIYNTTTKCFEFFENGSWYSMACVCTPPYVPVAVAPTGISQTGFNANWNMALGAAGYCLDVAEDSAFTSFVPGYNNLDVGNVLSKNITSLSCNTSYYYRVRAYNSCSQSGNSNTVSSSTASCCVALIALDDTNIVQQTTRNSSDIFTISTSYDNEIILIGVQGCCELGLFNGSVSVAGISPVTQVGAVTGNDAAMALFACAAPDADTYTITVTWGDWNWLSNYCMAYAASFSGFCETPSVAANVQSGITKIGTTSVSETITPAAANSCLFGDYWNFTATNSVEGNVTWTNNDLIRTDHQYGNTGWDGSIACKQLATTSPVTVTAVDDVAAYQSNGTVMILTVVHP